MGDQTVAGKNEGERSFRLEVERVRMGFVAPICAIVAVAVLCILAAVMTSAQRADQMALTRERQLLDNAMAEAGAALLRDLTRMPGAPTIADESGGPRNDLIVAIGPGELRILHDSGRTRLVHGAFTVADISPVLDVLRAHKSERAERPAHVSLLISFQGAPAIAAAMADPNDRSGQRVLVGLRAIDDALLNDIGRRLLLQNLHATDSFVAGADDADLRIFAVNGEPVARLVWTPRRSGQEIAASVVPFVLLAVAGFIVLVWLLALYMRRTAATIADSESRMRHLALHDPLSGLPNRIFFGERLEQAITAVRDGGIPRALFYLDLDHFKEVNDTLGHPVGDALIRNVTLRLAGALPAGDTVARLGGDEFAVIAACGIDAEALEALSARLLRTLCASYVINGQPIVVGASIGIAVIDGRVDSADLMRYADMALYRAKNEGRNCACIYDAAMDADLSNRKRMEKELRAALANDALHALYQPLVNASGEKIIGVEALARWRHPERGLIPPSEFIPVAEHSDLIFTLGQWMLRRACLDGLAWPNCTVAVNVSPMQFRRADFAETVERILAETGFDPHRLELEVTESTLLGNAEATEAAMLRLKRSGVKLALDDFGTGYSSLQYLRRFPFDKLKIDGSFVRSVENGADAASIIHALVGLGRGLRMKVTAEGVETPEQHLFLRAAGVHSMQGYRFGMPMPAADIADRLQSAAARAGGGDLRSIAVNG